MDSNIFFYKSEVHVCLCLVKASQQLSQFIEINGYIQHYFGSIENGMEDSFT